MYKKREDRLKAAHAEEIEEMQKRLAHWSRRVQQMSEEHQKELESEREKRKRDLKEQSEDHKATVDTIRADYAVLVDKIKELKTTSGKAPGVSTPAGSEGKPGQASGDQEVKLASVTSRIRMPYIVGSSGCTI